MSSELQCFQLGFVLRRTVRAVRINILAGVGFVQNILENPAVMNRSIGNLVLPDELVLDVHLDMILVAEVVFAPFLRPACIRIFLAFLRFAPVLDGRFSLLDRLVFLPCVCSASRPFGQRLSTGLLGRAFLIGDCSAHGRRRPEVSCALLWIS